jgi:hypothetical protein
MVVEDEHEIGVVKPEIAQKAPLITMFVYISSSRRPGIDVKTM